MRIKCEDGKKSRKLFSSGVSTFVCHQSKFASDLWQERPNRQRNHRFDVKLKRKFWIFFLWGNNFLHLNLKWLHWILSAFGLGCMTIWPSLYPKIHFINSSCNSRICRFSVWRWKNLWEDIFLWGNKFCMWSDKIGVKFLRRGVKFEVEIRGFDIKIKIWRNPFPLG